MLKSSMENYRRDLRENDQYQKLYISGAKAPDRGSEVVQIGISNDSLDDMYEKSLGRPLSNFNSELKRAAKIGETAVVLSGGTFCNREIRYKARTIIEKRKQRYLPWWEKDAPVNGWYGYHPDGLAMGDRCARR